MTDNELLTALVALAAERIGDARLFMSTDKVAAELVLAAIEPVIRADERERCAWVVDEYVEANKDYATVHYSALPAIAREIRNRKTTP